jgi:hypothetical protein
MTKVIMSDKSASEQIDDIIKQYGGWKGNVIKSLRDVITNADPGIVEEIKWKMATRPEGLPVWSYNGIVCFTETWKDNIKLIFFKGSQLTDPNKLFNARLKSSTVRAIELHEGDPIDKAGIKALVREAVKLNVNKTGHQTN